MPSPHAKQVRPIEPAWHQRLRLSRCWVGGLGPVLTGVGFAPLGPSVQGLAWWVGADLTAVELAPAAPRSAGLSRWAEAGPDDSRAGTGGSGERGVEQVGWG
ncbi:hypothetical protein GCM10010483_61990 [Actinokineospora diospyrosa]